MIESPETNTLPEFASPLVNQTFGAESAFRYVLPEVIDPEKEFDQVMTVRLIDPPVDWLLVSEDSLSLYTEKGVNKD